MYVFALGIKQMKGHTDSTLTTVCLSDEHSLKNESEPRWSETL